MREIPLASVEELVTDSHSVSEITDLLEMLPRERWTEAERIFDGAYWFFAEVLNGGFLQTFTNAAGSLRPEAEILLREGQNSELLGILEEAKRCFPNGNVPLDSVERNETLDSLVDFESGLDPFAEATEQVMALEQDLNFELCAYVRKHTSEFQNLE